MKSGYEILWAPHALNELQNTIEYLENNFSKKEIRKLAEKIELTMELISQNPDLFPKSKKKDIYKAIILKYNTVYYRKSLSTIEILSFFSNRQSPKKNKNISK